MTWYYDAGSQTVDLRQGFEELPRVTIDHHGHAVLDQDIPGEQHAFTWKPHHEISSGVSRAGMGDHESRAAQLQRIGGSHGTIGRIRELEATHGIQSHDSNPVGDESILSRFGCENPPVGVCNDFGTESPKYDRSEVVVRMVVSQHQPSDRLPGYPANGLSQLFALLGTGQCIDDHNAGIGNDEAGVRPSLRPPTSIPQRRVHSRSQASN
jgi:hypothetical protein